MATCKYCAKSGWLLQVDGNGLCDRCHAEHLPTIIQNCRLYETSVAIATKSKNPSTTLTRLVVAAQCCQALEPYSNRGITTIGMHPLEAISMLDASFDSAVLEAVSSITTVARLKSASASADAGRLSAYATAIDKLMKLFAEFPAVASFSAAARDLQVEQDALRCDLLLRKSTVAEAKGQTKKAIDFAIDALMSLEHDTTPNDLQSDLVRRVQDRITGLGGTVPK